MKKRFVVQVEAMSVVKTLIAVTAADAEEALAMARRKAGAQAKDGWAVDSIHVAGARGRILEAHDVTVAPTPVPAEAKTKPELGECAGRSRGTIEG